MNKLFGTVCYIELGPPERTALKLGWEKMKYIGVKPDRCMMGKRSKEHHIREFLNL